MGLLYDYHVMLILRFVKVTNGYVENTEHRFEPIEKQEMDHHETFNDL